MILRPQQFEISTSEALLLSYKLFTIMAREVDHENKLELFEVVAYPHIKSAKLKLSRRLAKAKSDGKFKITLSAQELIAIHQLVNDYPVELYNFLSTLDRKVLNYDSIVNIY